MAVYIEKGNYDELYVSFTYSYERVKRIKEIKGSRWNPVKKHWAVPNTLESINKIVIAFLDEEVILDPSIDIEGYRD